MPIDERHCISSRNIKSFQHLTHAYGCQRVSSVAECLANLGGPNPKHDAKYHSKIVREAVRNGDHACLEALRKWGLDASNMTRAEIARIVELALIHHATPAVLRELRLIGVAARLPDKNRSSVMHQILAVFALSGNIDGLDELKQWNMSIEAIRQSKYLPLELAAQKNNAEVLRHLHSFWNVTPIDLNNSKALMIAAKYKSYDALDVLVKQLTAGRATASKTHNNN